MGETQEFRHMQSLASWARFAMSKVVTVPPQQMFAAATLGGFVAVFSQMAEPSECGACLKVATERFKQFSMMQDEASDFVSSVADDEDVLQQLLEDDSALESLIEMVMAFPDLARLQGLFNVMPEKAAEMAVANAILVALGIGSQLPELAERVRSQAG